MALHLLELTPHTPSQENATALLDAVVERTRRRSQS